MRSTTGIICGLGSFAVQFGDHFRSGDHLRSGIICGAVQLAVSIAFRTLIERVTIRVSVFKAFFCSSRSLDGISRYISVNFLLFFAVYLNAQLKQFNYRNVEMFRNKCTYRPISEVTSRHVISRSGGQASKQIVCVRAKTSRLPSTWSSDT